MVRPLVAAEAGYDWHQQERLKAAEIAGRYPGWTVWTSRDGKSRLATRTGNQKDPNDGLWAATLICDDWTQLEKELAEQARYDAERICPPLPGTNDFGPGAQRALLAPPAEPDSDRGLPRRQLKTNPQENERWT